MSIYVDYDQSEDFTRLWGFIERQGVAIFREQLRADDLVLRPDVSDERVESTLRRAMENMLGRFQPKRLRLLESSDCSQLPTRETSQVSREPTEPCRSNRETTETTLNSEGLIASSEPHGIRDWENVDAETEPEFRDHGQVFGGFPDAQSSMADGSSDDILGDLDTDWDSLLKEIAVSEQMVKVDLSVR